MRLTRCLSQLHLEPVLAGNPGRLAGFEPRARGNSAFEPGHGEQIWVFKHYVTKQVVYSHKPVVKANRVLRQLPFNGKKSKPAKLRKDYWRKMALIQFPLGQGVVGQNVMQKLRELRHLHEVSWGYQAKQIVSASTKRNRGTVLNNQLANTVADMAAVLGGAGQGNKINMRAVRKQRVRKIRGVAKLKAAKEAKAKAKAAGQEKGGVRPVASNEESLASQAASESGAGSTAEEAAVTATEPASTLAGPTKPATVQQSEPELPPKLRPATVYWAEEGDQYFARTWPPTVSHKVGIPNKTPESQKRQERLDREAKLRQSRLEAAAKAEQDAATRAARLAAQEELYEALDRARLARESVALKAMHREESGGEPTEADLAEERRAQGLTKVAAEIAARNPYLDTLSTAAQLRLALNLDVATKMQSEEARKARLRPRDREAASADDKASRERAMEAMARARVLEALYSDVGLVPKSKDTVSPK